MAEDEEKQLMDEIKTLGRKEEGKVMELTTSWHRKGREEGRGEGIKEGFEAGKKETLIEVARKMLEKGYTIEEIEIITKLSKETIKSLMN